ncbi:MAG: pilus assembly protein PilY [Burkholderiaceae bacterium]|nr:pilus assembly protein PilY [Burkholderiaceae bacterium]
MASDSSSRSGCHRTLFSRLRPQSIRGWVAGAGLAIMALTSLVVVGQSGPPSIPAINLPNEPLFGISANDKPAMALALSVEFPTVGAQYTVKGQTQDTSYNSDNEYLGYYDAESCYTYNDQPLEAPATGKAPTDYKRFDRSGPAKTNPKRQCADAFSGNFLNWASNSAIDMLRLALSGGDRYIDENNLTVLQRAVLPNGDPTCFWNTQNFPAKQLPKDGGGTGAYWGAVPASMRADANGKPIWVANTLNRIYFRSGTSSVGSGSSACVRTNYNDYTLGSKIGPITDSTSRPGGMTECASEGGSCQSSSGLQEVWYGPSSGNGKMAPAKGTLQCNSTTFDGDPSPGQAKKCYTRTYTSTAWTPPSGTGLNSNGYFFSRVQVCNANASTLEDVRDYGLCKKYPNGNYKPTGVIQKYADQIRLSAFGYLMDQTASYNSGGRYGGVLRAPMKYVGQKKFDIYGTEEAGGNPKAEWEEKTGIFIKNPENDTTFGVSGVINYLNQFGRTGPTPGMYKKYDPVGELYYQALRYMQGLPPTPDAIANLGTLQKSNPLYDGYPVYTNWTDIDGTTGIDPDPYGGGRTKDEPYACLKSNIVVIGDINTHDGNWRNVTPDAAKNVPNFKTFHTQVRTYESSSNSNSSAPSSSQTSQIMGYAYWAHANDIRGTGWTGQPDKQRPGLRVKTFIFDVNEYGGSTDLATRSKSNQFFMAAKYGGFENDPSNLGNNPYNDLSGTPNPHKDSKGNVNSRVWQRDDGDASTYYLQSDARKVLKAFDEIFNRSSSKARSIAKPGANSTTIKVGSTPLIYQGGFDTSDWSGDVEAKAIAMSLDANGNPSYSYTLRWSAAAKLAELTNPATSRNIVIGTSSGAVDFSSSSTFDFVTADEIKYLRGDKSLEGTAIDGNITWRKRSALLGDVVNSGVVYSGAPSRQISEAGYKDFYDDNKDRTPAVFVGANDGMLHAFNATTGDELFAYIPKTMSSKLSALTRSTFVGNHQNYVDGLITVSEAKVGSAGTKADWKTVLVAVNGSGARGVFALDVTNPSAFTANNAMWEFTSADDADMGYVIGQPQILKMRTSASSATYKWFAVVASGVNNYINDGAGKYSATGAPALFFLSLDKEAGTAWSLGSNYYKISLPVNATASATKPTGVANFLPLLDGYGTVKEIFVGDYHGNIWNLQFNIRGLTTWRGTSDWTSSKLSPFVKSETAYPLYIAKDAAGNRQVIHEAPVVLSGPVVNDRETFFVFGGTGKLVESADKNSTASHSIYALHDNGTTTTDDNTTPVVINGRARLQAGTVNTTAKTVTVGSFTWGRPTKDGDMTERAGWYADLPTTGERVVGLIQILGRKAIFNTQIPTSAGASGGCSAGTSTTNTYVVDIPTGVGQLVSRPGPESPALLFEDMTPPTNEKVTDPTGRRVQKKMYRSITTGQGTNGSDSSIEVKKLLGRLSWRYINNYQDLKNTAGKK